ncbi:MAG: 3-deoxy-manno-octulosonate cytidylyltransferase [Lentisphaeria bacterium]
MRVIACIPARYESSRFPGKPLAEIAGKPMIQRVVERAAAARNIDEVWVATDDERIVAAVEEVNGKAVMTASEHCTGTDRIAEALENVEADLVINLQGDEPLVPPGVIDRLVEAMIDCQAEMGTVAVPFDQADSEPNDFNVVKVVVDDNDYALYFSRSLIPFPRPGGKPVTPLLHWGLYAYRRSFLERFVKWPPGQLERCEMLEQLRALENGARIKVIRAETPVKGVDVPEDIEKVEKMLIDSDSKRG